MNSPSNNMEQNLHFVGCSKKGSGHRLVLKTGAARRCAGYYARNHPARRHWQYYDAKNRRYVNGGARKNIYRNIYRKSNPNPYPNPNPKPNPNPNPIYAAPAFTRAAPGFSNPQWN